MGSPFRYRFSALIAQLAEMCAMAAQAINDATYALLHADIEVAEGVIARREDTAAMSSAVQETTFLLLESQTPWANDRRAAISAIQIGADAARMGQLAVDVAKIARRHHPDPAVPEEVSTQLADMGATAAALARAAQEALLSRDPWEGPHIDRDDDAVDELARKLLAAMIDRGWPHGVAIGVQVAQLGWCYQRFADHARQIARRASFPTTEHFRPSTMAR
jgi:phosphate transport system protein